MKTAFTINISQQILDDLKSRLSGTRWPHEIENDDWKLGTNKSYLKKLCSYWQDGFDWGKQQNYLNTFSHYKDKIDEVGIHYIYEKGKGQKFHSPVTYTRLS